MEMKLIDVNKEDLWAGIEAAHEKKTSLATADAQDCQLSPATAEALSEAEDYPDPVASPAIDIEELRSALAVLEPDCDERTWAVYRIGALSNAAREHPEFAERLFALAVEWSSGKLRRRKALTWAKAGSQGRARRAILHFTWERFKDAPFTGRRVTLATVFFHAREAGWEQGSKD